MEKIEVTLRAPLEMEYRRGSRELILTGVEASGRQVTVRLEPNATWLLSTGLVPIVQAQGPLGEEPTQGRLQ